MKYVVENFYALILNKNFNPDNNGDICNVDIFGFKKIFYMYLIILHDVRDI